MTAMRFFHVCSILFVLLNKFIYSILVLCKYKIIPNIIIGKKCFFYGFPQLRNKPGGSILIGPNCTFLSKSTSNLIGINRPCIISTNTKIAKVEIGNHCGFSGTVIGAFVSIKLGNHVRCGANTLITDSDWHTDDPRSGMPMPVIIEDHVWLGEGVKVLKGVTIGQNSVIGAGSIVVKSIPANVIAAGNPCKVIKSISKSEG